MGRSVIAIALAVVASLGVAACHFVNGNPDMPVAYVSDAGDAGPRRLGDIVQVWNGDLDGSTNANKIVTGLQKNYLPPPTVGALQYDGGSLYWGTVAGGITALTQDVTASGSGSVAAVVAAISGTGGGDVPFTSSGLKTAGPLNIKDNGAVVRDTFSTTHGLFTAGGGGTDWFATMGPFVGYETTQSALWLLANGTALSASNYTLQTSAAATYLNAPSGAIQLLWNAGTGSAYFATSRFYLAGSTPAAPLFFDWGAATTPLIQSGTSATSLTVGTNKAGAGLLLNVDANAPLFGLYGGTQNSVALGANLATTGHQRSTQSWVWNARKFDDSGDYNVLTLNADAFTLGNSTASLAIADNTITHGATTALTETLNATGATQLQIATGVTSFGINWAAASGAAAATTITGQAAGGASGVGGPVVLAGGTHAGTHGDGSVKVTTPFNGGLYSFTPAAGTINLTNAQSNANFVYMLSGSAGPFTVNFLRDIADTSCVFIKNTSGQSCTIAFISGGMAGMAAGTSALICSDGANLQKVMTGT